MPKPLCIPMEARLAALVLIFGPVAFQPVPAQADEKPHRIGYLSASTPERDRPLLKAFREELETLGHNVGRTVVIEKRFANGHYARLPGLAAQLVALKVDVIVGSGPVPKIAKKATDTIPIVMRTSNPVGTGLAASLARPGGNVTGLATFSARLVAKRLELLKEAVPSVRRVAVLHLLTGSHPRQLKVLQKAALEQGVELLKVPVRPKQPGSLDSAFAALARLKPDGFMIFAASFFETNRKRILNQIAKIRVPAIYAYDNWPRTGGLMSYGTDVPALYRRMAAYVHKILNGARPADLPIEQPSEFRLVLNLKTANRLGISFLPSILLRADEVIE